MPIHLEPIATVSSPRKEILDDDWGSVESRIEIDARFPEDALDGLDSFSHVEVLFFFDRVPEDKIVSGARHPRNNPDWPAVGIFAQRGKNRPNRLGHTIAEIRRREGRSLWVAGLDAIDGTPVLDLKPVMREFLPRTPVRQPEWSHALMEGYWEAPR